MTKKKSASVKKREILEIYGKITGLQLLAFPAFVLKIEKVALIMERKVLIASILELNLLLKAKF